MPNLDALADEMDVFLMGAFGVLNMGDTAIEGVPERVARLQNVGKRMMIVSNAAGFPYANLMEKYKRLGYDFAPEDCRYAVTRGTFRLSSQYWEEGDVA